MVTFINKSFNFEEMWVVVVVSCQLCGQALKLLPAVALTGVLVDDVGHHFCLVSLYHYILTKFIAKQLVEFLMGCDEWKLFKL